MSLRAFARLLLLASLLCLIFTASAGAARHPRIINGRPAQPGEWPWLVALVHHDQDAHSGQFCGGTVIAPQLVLTAGHCVHEKTAGTIDVVANITSLTDEANGQRVPVTQIDTAPGWDYNTMRHDMAVLHLAQPVSAPPLPLAGPADLQAWNPGQTVSVAGWGATAQDPDQYPDQLNTVDLQVDRQKLCGSAYKGYDPAITLCVGAPPSNDKDACFGDSGGPLITRAGGQAKLIGTVSFGGDHCADPKAPGVYAKVAAELRFLDRELGVPYTGPMNPQISLRWGKLVCPSSKCQLSVVVSGADRPLVSAVKLTVTRKKSSLRTAYAKTVTLSKVAPGIFRATTLIPLGNVHVQAQGVDVAGADLGKRISEWLAVKLK